MAKTTTIPLIVTAVLLAVLPITMGQSPAPGPSVLAPSPGPDCFTYLLNLSDCLTFVEPDSNLTRPHPGCCPELSNLVDTEPTCLCELLGHPGQVGLTIDVQRALKLPSVCNVTTPPVSFCAAIGVPVGALAPSEGPSLSPGGSEAAMPSPVGNDNGSPRNLASKQNFLIGLAVVLLTPFF